MKLNPLILMVALFYQCSVFGQSKPNYHPPLDIPLILASNFGELRPNHFHMGVDFKTMGTTGYKLYSIEKGYVSRIVVSPYGYGKVIHIAHPNGISSVYAHCTRFSDKIDSIVDARKVLLKQNQVDLKFKPSEIPVQRGEVIGISGNTGASMAPHLHFELRETKTDAALNPLIYGFDIKDTRQPEISRLKIYALTSDGYRYDKSREYSVRRSGDQFYCRKEIHIPSDFCSKSGGIGFAFGVVDRLDDAHNQCGLYSSELRINERLHFAQKIDKVPFEATRYINTHTDYEEFTHSGNHFHKSFKTSENVLPIYTVPGNGVYKARPGDTLNIEYLAKDASGNVSRVCFMLIVDQGEMNPLDAITEDLSYLQPGYPLTIKRNDLTVHFDAGTVYEPIKIDKEKLHTQIGERNIPVQNSYHLVLNRETSEKEYLEIATLHGRTREIIFDKHSPVSTCDLKYFGNYSVRKDTIAPNIHARSGSSSVYRKMQWSISDHQTGIKDYYLTIGNQWIPLDYEYKNSTVTAVIPDSVKGVHTATFTVVDECGNKKVWTKELTFK